MTNGTGFKTYHTEDDVTKWARQYGRINYEDRDNADKLCALGKRNRSKSP